MRSVETDWWVLDLPEEWEAEQDEETVVIGDEDGVGALEISTLRKHEEGGAFDLNTLAAELIPAPQPGRPVQLAGLGALYFQYLEEGEAVREWLVDGGELLLLISYSCAAENAGFDDSVVDEILDTLQLKLETNPDANA
jgi:hypothetical protein